MGPKTIKVCSTRIDPDRLDEYETSWTSSIMSELSTLEANPSRDQFRGLMVGTAVGDCLGRPVEGHRQVSDSYITEVLESPPPLIYTDDTVMTMMVAESLLASEGLSGEDMSMRFAEAYQADPNRGYGRNVVDVFDRVLRGVPWREAASRQFGGEGSYGNGAAMRVSPVALWTFPDIHETAWLAAETARVTHTHPVGVEGAVIQAVAACHGLNAGVGSLDTESLLSDLDRLAHTEEFRSKLEILPGCLDQDDDERARLHLGNWVSAHNSVVTALYCFILSTSFEDAIVRALRMGGDTDTIAAMAGALAGARHGLGGIPRPWREVEGYERLAELADALFSAHP